MHQRGFLAGLIAAAVLDPERLLWVPAKKTISIPRPASFRTEYGHMQYARGFKVIGFAARQRRKHAQRVER